MKRALKLFVLLLAVSQVRAAQIKLTFEVPPALAAPMNKTCALYKDNAREADICRFAFMEGAAAVARILGERK